MPTYGLSEQRDEALFADDSHGCLQGDAEEELYRTGLRTERIPFGGERRDLPQTGQEESKVRQRPKGRRRSFECQNL